MAGHLMATGTLSRRQRSRNARAKRQLAASRRKAAKSAAGKARRAALRHKLGALRDRVIRESTRRRHRECCKSFLQWLERTGRRVPDAYEAFDVLCCSWAEHL